MIDGKMLRLFVAAALVALPLFGVGMYQSGSGPAVTFVKETRAENPPAEQRPAAWYPRTEKLGPDEMFVVALGTGMPTPITRGQKSTAWYVELGNGDIFLFDIGSGSAENLFALRPEFHRIDKIFVSHLHTDHVGDAAAVWVGGWLSGRYMPLHIFGPSGATPELGPPPMWRG
jgi:ribonuclease Z